MRRGHFVGLIEGYFKHLSRLFFLSEIHKGCPVDILKPRIGLSPPESFLRGISSLFKFSFLKVNPGEVIVSSPIEIITFDEFTKSIDGFIIISLIATDEAVHVVGFLEFRIETKNLSGFKECPSKPPLNEIRSSELIMSFEEIILKMNSLNIVFLSFIDIVCACSTKMSIAHHEQEVGIFPIKDEWELFDTEGVPEEETKCFSFDIDGIQNTDK